MSKFSELDIEIQELEELIAIAESVCEHAYSSGNLAEAEDAFEELCRLRRNRAVIRDVTGF